MDIQSSEPPIPIPLPATDPAALLASQIIKYFESCILHPYQDFGGVWTIGWGTTTLADGSPVTEETPELSQAEADSLLAVKIQQAVNVVDSVVERIVSIPQIAALASFVYNLGPGNFKASLLLQDLNHNLPNAQIAIQINRWVYQGGVREGGLVARRMTEANLFCTGHLIFFDKFGKVVRGV